MNDFQKYIHISKYARWMDEKGRRENWDETVGRYIEFFRNRPRVKNADHSHMEADLGKLYNAIYNLEVLPSMRCFMTAGRALERDEIACYNCAAIAINNVRSFDEMFYLLMNGCGVGFSVERQYINQLPSLPEELYDSESVIKVRDSKIGWASSLKELIASLYAGSVPTWDVSSVRPAGTRLRTFGGRACLTGDTIVYKDRKKSKGYNEVTIKQLYEMKNRLGKWKHNPTHFNKILLRSLDEDSGIFYRNKLLDVIDNGDAKVYEILTEQGYRIKATENHRFMNELGEYQYLSEFCVGDSIAVNGSKTWKTGTCTDCGTLISRRAKRCKPCHDKSRQKNDCSFTTARARKDCQEKRKDSCEYCGISDIELHVHHDDENPRNNTEKNCITLCESCHRKEHAKRNTYGNPYSHKYLSYDRIISIEYVGIERVYDLCMKAPNHNFIANGFVSHNSGPEPLISLFNFIIRTFKRAVTERKEKLNSLEVHDICCKIADTVIAGSVRRAACISFSNLTDDRLRRAKVGDWYSVAPYRALANNSVAYTEKPDLDAFSKEWRTLYKSKSGERGIVNKEALRAKAEGCGREWEGDYLLNP